MTEVRVATLMAVYKGDTAVALASALDSILSQRLNDNVVSRLYLAVDGPISQQLDDVIQSKKESIYRVMRFERNRGLASALNGLIELLEDEEFVFRMDADDKSELNRYQAQLDYMMQNPDVDILGTDVVEVDISMGVRRRVSYCRNNLDALRDLCRRVPVAHPTVCFRRYVLLNTGGYPVAGTNEDLALWFLCAKRGYRFGNVHEPLLQFTINQDFWKRRSFNKAFSEFKCYVGGIWSIDGVSWKYIFPFARMLLRLLPVWLSRWAYSIRLR